MSNLAIFNKNSEETVLLGRSMKTMEEKMMLANATTNPDYKLSQFINRQLYLTNYYLERVTINREDGTTYEAIRTVLFDKDGKTYNCVSNGVPQALKSFISIFGSADQWSEPLPVVVEQVERGRGRMLTLRVGYLEG